MRVAFFDMTNKVSFKPSDRLTCFECYKCVDIGKG